MTLGRRDFITILAGAGAGSALTDHEASGGPAEPRPQAVARRRIPSTGELLPMIGLGTSRTFNVDPQGDIGPLVDVMRAFLAAGGTLIDSSPMYGHAEEVVGTLLDRVGRHDVFFATKVWTDQGREAGEEQMADSMRKMGAPVVDLMQVHNLVAWETHLPTLREWKQAGRIRYVGITEMRDFGLVEKLMREQDLDFIQVPYSITDRVRSRPAVPTRGGPGTSGLGGRDRLRQLGAALPQVRPRPSGGHVPDSGDLEGPSSRRQHAGGRGAAARRDDGQPFGGAAGAMIGWHRRPRKSPAQ
ncbi:MAG: aldo/keto reductase [Planctomycetota bacterium]